MISTVGRQVVDNATITRGKIYRSGVEARKPISFTLAIRRRMNLPLHDCPRSTLFKPPFFLLHGAGVIKYYLDKVSFDVRKEKRQIGYPRSLDLLQQR